jgi:hypothetical protein
MALANTANLVFTLSENRKRIALLTVLIYCAML